MQYSNERKRVISLYFKLRLRAVWCTRTCISNDSETSLVFNVLLLRDWGHKFYSKYLYRSIKLQAIASQKKTVLSYGLYNVVVDGFTKIMCRILRNFRCFVVPAILLGHSVTVSPSLCWGLQITASD